MKLQGRRARPHSLFCLFNSPSRPRVFRDKTTHKTLEYLSFPPKPRSSTLPSLRQFRYVSIPVGLKMGIGARPTSSFSSGDEEEANNRSISQLVSSLRSAFRPEVFDWVEEALVVREVKLKRELEKKVAVAEERHQLEQLERLKQLAAVEKERDNLLEEVKKKREKAEEDNSVISELRRKHHQLESDKLRLEREYEALENRISWLEDETGKLLKEEEERARVENGGTIDYNGNSKPDIILENGLGSIGNGHVAASERGSSPSDHLHSRGNGDVQTSGIPKFSSGDVVVISDSDDDCAAGVTVHEQENFESHEDRDCLGLTGLQDKGKVLKRKRTLSPSISDNEKGGVIGGRTDFYQSLREGSDDSDDSSSSSSSSSDSEDAIRIQPLFNDIMQKIEAAKGNCSG